MDFLFNDKVPASLCHLFRALHKSNCKRITPQIVMTDHIVPRVVQTFYTWFSSPDAIAMYKPSSSPFELADLLKEALSNVLDTQNSLKSSRSIVNGAVLARSKFSVNQFYTHCISSEMDSVNLSTNRQILHHVGNENIHNQDFEQSAIDTLFNTVRGEKPFCITDLVCLTAQELQLILSLYARAIGRGIVVDRQMNSIGYQVGPVVNKLQEMQNVVFTIESFEKEKDVIDNLLEHEDSGMDLPGYSELSNAGWLVKAIKLTLQRIRVENNFNLYQSNVKELILLRDRLVEQSDMIACILRDLKRMDKYREVLMEYKAQINAYIDKKNEESVYGVSNSSTDKFFRYFSALSFRLRSLESEISSLSQSKIKMNFLFQPKRTRKLQKLVASSNDGPLSSLGATTSMPTRGNEGGAGADNRTKKQQQQVNSSFASGSASPLKVLMQSLFTTNLSE